MTQRADPRKRHPRKECSERTARRSILGFKRWVRPGLCVAICSVLAPAIVHAQQPAVRPPAAANPQADAPIETPTLQQQGEQQLPGIIRGIVVDPSGAAVGRAQIKLTQPNRGTHQEIASDADGEFSFVNVLPGPFKLTVTATGFATLSISGVLQPGELHEVPQITLAVAAANTQVQVVASTVEVAEEQIKVEETQRVLGFIPNFYVTYVPNAEPLNPRQKFQLAWKTVLDPVTFAITGAAAGLEQAQDQFGGYGQGASGYGKRYGAAFGDLVSSTFISNAILPSILKQDPRYFYKGTGTTRSRILYAIANAVICKGDNRRWQANYSDILGGVAAAGISNLYYPNKDRGAGLVFENTGIGIGGAAVNNLLQEFVVPKFTKNFHRLNSNSSTSNP
jgi:hypothetical protein